jgi:hypothetical protein
MLPPDQASDTSAKNVRLIIEVRHDLSVHSVAASVFFDGPADALSATPGVSNVTTGGLLDPDGGKKRPLICRLAEKVTSKVIAKVRRYGIQALLGRRRALLLENLLEVIPEEPSAPDLLEGLDPQAIPYVMELAPNDTTTNGIAGKLEEIPPLSSPISEISMHL